MTYQAAIGHPVSERGLGERGMRSRHLRICRGKHPALVAQDGLGPISRSPPSPHHRRRRGRQKFPMPPLEVVPGAVERGDRSGDQRLPLPSGHQQVEQDRASAFLSHHPELAGQSPRQPRSRRRTHCCETTRAGLEVRAEADQSHYQTKLKPTPEQMASIRMTRNDFHGEWYYTISPPP